MLQELKKVYSGKTVLVTGHTGFKGSWLSIWLKELGANVIGYALEPYSDEDNFVKSNLEEKITHIIGDIRDYNNLLGVFNKYNPEFVFHLAAQPIVLTSYEDPKLTYDTNVGGTVNLFECCRMIDSVKVIVNVTTDKCYENKEKIWGYREDDAMGGFDPYSSSKGCSELVTAAYRNSFFERRGVALASGRAGNVIGGGDWQANRIMPDCIRALKKGKQIEVRSPKAVRPWQHVLEPLSGYLLLAAKLSLEGKKYAEGWNFGPDFSSVITVKEIVSKTIEIWGSGSMNIAQMSSKPHEAQLLSLDITKARQFLSWRPLLSIDETIKLTVDWYKKDGDMYKFDVSQIKYYMEKWN